MDYGEFSKKELSDILDLVHNSTACSTDAGLKSLMSGLKDLVNADCGICALGDSTGQILKFVNLSYPEEWLSMYAGGEFGKKDPVVLYNLGSSKPFFWSDSLKAHSEKEHLDLMNDASEFGLRYGIASGVKSPGKGVGSIFSFSGGQGRFTGHHLKILDIATPHIHQVLLKLAGGVNGAAHGLSAREKEVLTLMKRGISYMDISRTLKISLSTVKYHVQNIKEKLDAVNKAHAIAIAADSGL